MEIKEAKQIMGAGLAWANWTGEQREAMKIAYKSMTKIEQYEKTLLGIKEAYESKDENRLDELLYGLFTNEIYDDSY